METAELLKKVRSIEIKTKGLTANIFAGEYESAFKGRGMAFSEVREYQPGDDVRTIDWKVTARLNHPYIKVFEEERELTLMLIIDVSGSEDFGSTNELKKERIAEIAAVIAFSAIQNNDKIGVILFSDLVEKFIPPKKGRKHVLMIIREILNFEPEHQGTNIANALQYFSNVIKKRSTAFVISDFMDQQFENAYKSVRRKHDLISLRVLDPIDAQIPASGIVHVVDKESGKSRYIDFASRKVRREYEKLRAQRSKELSSSFSRMGLDYIEMKTNESYVTPLIRLFKNR